MRRVRLSVIVAIILTVAAAAPAWSAPGERFPERIDLPAGFFPEGIDVGAGSTFYIGSLANGSVYKGDLRTGEGTVVVGPTGPFTTIGIEVDNRERIWVAGGPSGTGRVYDGNTGELLASYTFTGPFQSFINDVVVSGEAAYFTDSGTSMDPDPGAFRFAGEPRLFVVPLGAGGALPDQSEVSELTLDDVPDITFPNLNGIETAPNGKALIVGHTSGAMLFAVDKVSGEAAPIDVGVPLFGNDGLIRRGTTLYVVENAAGQVSAVKLSPDASKGSVSATYPVTGSQTPTTAGVFGNALYVADARFVSMAGPYEVFRVELR